MTALGFEFHLTTLLLPHVDSCPTMWERFRFPAARAHGFSRCYKVAHRVFEFICSDVCTQYNLRMSGFEGTEKERGDCTHMALP